MLIRYLSPLEKYDFKSVCGRNSRRWSYIWFWIFIGLLAARLFLPLPDIFWHQTGYLCVLLGAYIAFLGTPYLVYHLIGKRVKDGTLHFEMVMPFPKGSLFGSKLRTIFFVLLSWTWSLYAIGWLSDPTLSFTREYLAGAFFQPVQSAPSGIVLLALTTSWYGGLWLMTTFLLIGRASTGSNLIELMGRHVFLLLSIFLIAAILINRLTQGGSGNTVPGYVPFVLLVDAGVLGFSVLFYNSAARRLIAHG